MLWLPLQMQNSPSKSSVPLIFENTAIARFDGHGELDLSQLFLKQVLRKALSIAGPLVITAEQMKIPLKGGIEAGSPDDRILF
jgi:hypothetical protein